MFKKVLHEPLLHFLVLGALLFFIYDISDKENPGDQQSIVISKDRIAQLVSEWEKKSLSLPTQKDKQEIIEKEIYQRVLYKEALKIGLDKNDITIKEHLAKKMEALIFDTQELASPDDEKLKKFMQENLDRYRQEQKISFEQRMIGVKTEPFKRRYTLTKFETANIFGRTFAQMLFDFGVEGKVDKIESDYGIHEVRIIKKDTPKPKSFEEIKQKLKDDYLRVQREKKNEETYKALKSQYNIRIEEK